MKISTRHVYSATPDQVIAMMADERWLSEVARRAGAQRHEVSVSHGTSHVVAEMPAPEKVRRFVGSTLRIELDITWGAVGADGSADGRIQVAVVGLPARMSGSGRMIAMSVDPRPSTAVDYTAEFTITVPLVGKSLESTAAPYVQRVIDLQQQVGDDYLAGRLD